VALYGVALATLADDPGLCPEANAFVAGLSRPNGSERRRFANRAEVLEGPFERCIQQFETEIDFGISRRQWRGNAHDPVRCAGAHDVGAQSEMHRVVSDRIRERGCRVPLAPVKRFEFYS